jgi:membrane-bound serine protease (ClpP class)
MAGGAALAIGAAGGAIALIIGAILAASAVTGLWLAIATRKGLATRQLRVASGREALSGRTGVVRSWNGGDGQVFVDGALWRARPSWPDSEDELAAGDAVVVERVSGLTLAVRKAEEWEEP